VQQAGGAWNRQAGHRDVVQPVTDGDTDDLEYAQESQDHRAASFSFSMRLDKRATSSRSFVTSWVKPAIACGRISIGFSSRKYSAAFSLAERCRDSAASNAERAPMAMRRAAISPTTPARSPSASQRSDWLSCEIVLAKSASPSIFT